MNNPSEVEFIKITLIDNAIEAQIIGSVLETSGIPHRLRSYHDTAYDGLFQAQKGWGEIRAPSEFKDEILEIVKDVRKGTQST